MATALAEETTLTLTPLQQAPPPVRTRAQEEALVSLLTEFFCQHPGLLEGDDHAN